MKRIFSPILIKPMLLIAGFLALISSLSAITIKEKKEGLSQGTTDLDPQTRALLQKVNVELVQKQDQLKNLYAQVALLYDAQAPESSFQQLLQHINTLKGEMDALDNRWRDEIVKSNQGEEYGLWYQPDTTVEQLVIDYGSQDYVYVIPGDVGLMKLSVASNLPVPRSSWNEMLELILTHNGVGIEQINPYLRKLYMLSTDNSAVKVVTNRRQDLQLFPENSRICFVLTPEPSEVRRIWFFLDKFVDHNNTLLQLIGRDILIIGTVNEVQDLLKLYDFAAANKGDKDFKLVSLAKIQAEEMSKILDAIFDHTLLEKHKPVGRNANEPPEISQAETNGLKVIVLEKLAQALFLIGTREEISKAEQIIREVDGQLGDVREKVIYWYTAKNSEAEALAEVLSKIYNLMVFEKVGAEHGKNPFQPFSQGSPMAPGFQNIANSPAPGAPVADIVPLRPLGNNQSFYQDGSVVINPAPVTLGTAPKEFTNDDRHNFIVDVKSNAIVMVVEADILPKMKDLIKKLDIPKKMVEIEVLLFEKQINDTTNYGLNLLRIGSAASNKDKTSLLFSDLAEVGGRRGNGNDGPVDGVLDPINAFLVDPLARGITSFLFSRKKTDHFPALDMVYRFLLTQEDVTINSNPSVLTMNQSPAKIAIVQERSIDTGAVESDGTLGTVRKTFTRAQYGITLEITPTIFINNTDDDDEDNLRDGVDYVSLATSVTFDTESPGARAEQPNVVRRNIENEVLIANGETVILGGLRSKRTTEAVESIPFIGEIPGIGKLFSNTRIGEESAEMFIFITPRIVYDPVCDLQRMRAEEMCRRPGDIPEFLACLVEARESEKNRLLAGTMRMLCGPADDRVYTPAGEYDGR